MVHILKFCLGQTRWPEKAERSCLNTSTARLKRDQEILNLEERQTWSPVTVRTKPTDQVTMFYF